MSDKIKKINPKKDIDNFRIMARIINLFDQLKPIDRNYIISALGRIRSK